MKCDGSFMPLDEEYYFKDIRGRRLTFFEVTKFNFRRYPEVVYKLFKNRAGWHCDCPGWISHRDCKHIYMVIKWIEAGMPSPFSRFEPTKAEIEELFSCHPKRK